MLNLKIILFLIILSYSNVFAFSNEQAIELGMTPVEELNEEFKYFKSNEFNNDQVNSILAKVVVIVNESDRSDRNPEGQTAKVYQFGDLKGTFNVSTGSRKIKTTSDGRQYKAITREGFFRPKKVYSDYFSFTFFGAPMSHAIFFNGGIALHGTNNLRMLGKRDSGGCVRFDPKDIKFINKLMRLTGEGHDRVKEEKICREVDSSGQVIKNLSSYNGIKATKCYSRTKHLDRIKIENIERYTGILKSSTLWSYDALIIIKSP
jgi:hypothetical protein